jgi:DNA-binding XRE family transcriptional regulator
MAVRREKESGDTLDEFIRDERERDPRFRAEFDAEVARLRWAREIKALREGARLTQAQLASRAGTHQTAIARLESGRVVPSLDLVERLARVAGRHVELRFVATRDGTKRPAARGRRAG